MLNVKQGGIEYHFLSLWYDSTSAVTLVSCFTYSSDRISVYLSIYLSIIYILVGAENLCVGGSYGFEYIIEWNTH